MIFLRRSNLKVRHINTAVYITLWSLAAWQEVLWSINHFSTWKEVRKQNSWWGSTSVRKGQWTLIHIFNYSSIWVQSLTLHYVLYLAKINFIHLWNLYEFLRSFFYPLVNKVAKGYTCSNATVRPSFHNILVNTLESTSFNGFWPNLVHT